MEEDCVQENNDEVLMAKADGAPDGEPGDEGPLTPSKAPKKKRRAIWIVLAVLGGCLLFGLGAVAGGGAVFGLTRARSRLPMRPSVDRWVSPREMPHMDLPMRPGRGMMGLEAGALIVEVVPDSPADQAGLSEGDVVVAVEGKELDKESDLAAMIAEHKPGDQITIDVAEFGPRLDQEGREVTVTLTEHPEAAGKAYLGVTFVPTSDDDLGGGGRMYWFHEFGDDDPGEHCDGGDGCVDEHRMPKRHFEFRWPRR